MTLSETLKLLFIICLCNFVQGLTDAEVKAELTKTIIKCTKEVPVEMSELMQLQALKVPKKTETKCLLACAYKKLGSLNKKGMYDLERGYRIAELSKNGDEKRLENGRKLADICSKNLKAKAKNLTGCHEYQQQTSRRRKRNTNYDHFSGSSTLDEFVEKETPVNDVEVSDGDKGCERAALLFKCVIENAPKLGFEV